MEHRLTYRQRNGQPKIEIAWDAIEQAGNDLMTKRGQVEHGYALAGQLVRDDQGGVTAKVNRVIGLGSGNAHTFEVSPELARDLAEYEYGPNERLLGLAHSHRRIHAAAPSRADVDYARALTNERVCMVIKLNEDENGNRDGGGKISVFNGDGYVDYSIVGNDGQKQEFKAEEMGTNVDAQRLRSPVDPPKPEYIRSRRNAAA